MVDSVILLPISPRIPVITCRYHFANAPHSRITDVTLP